jgi:hypothetical protein
MAGTPHVDGLQREVVSLGTDRSQQSQTLQRMGPSGTVGRNSMWCEWVSGGGACERQIVEPAAATSGCWLAPA